MKYLLVIALSLIVLSGRCDDLFSHMTDPDEYIGGKANSPTLQKIREKIAKFEKGELRPGFRADGTRIDHKPANKDLQVIISTGPEITVIPTNKVMRLGVVELNGIDLAKLGLISHCS